LGPSPRAASPSPRRDLKRRSKKIKTSDEIAEVSAIAANGEKMIGEKIAEAMQKLGNEGVITVEEST
jgi:chaperonin GroEL